MFISYNILCESVERIFEPIKIEDDGLITVSVLGLIVNGIGLVFFHEFHHHGEECSHGHSHSHAPVEEHTHHAVSTADEEESHTTCEHSHEEPHHHHHEEAHHHHDHQHENENMYGIYLHILADALGSVGVIISSILVKYYDLQIADPICSSIISVLIFASVIPLIK